MPFMKSVLGLDVGSHTIKATELNQARYELMMRIAGPGPAITSLDVPPSPSIAP